MRIAVVAFNTNRERPVANKKFDDERRAAAYLLEVLLRDSVEFVSVRKIKEPAVRIEA
jgi:hypothetical protein